MASFKSHISFGILTAVALTALLVYFSMVSGLTTFIVFILTVIGSMLPDIDSDTGIPVRILFGVISIIFAALGLFYLDEIWNVSLIEKILYSIGGGLGTYFIVGNIFKKLTVHRGILHSVPAALVFGLGAMKISEMIGLYYKTSVSFGLAVSIGYLCHLLLDELNSGVNLSGGSFLPKKSLGTALQLWAPSAITSILMYITLFSLIVLNMNLLIRVIPNDIF